MYVGSHAWAYMCACEDINTHTMHMYVYIHVYMNVYMHVCMYVYAYIIYMSHRGGL